MRLDTKRILARRAVLTGTLVAFSVNLAACASVQSAQAELAPDRPYVLPPAAVPGPPGSVISLTPLDGGPARARTYRLVYWSRDQADRPVAVSAVAFVPAAPAAGRPVIAWAHPTTGVIPRCAPSLSPLRDALIPGLGNMLARGFIVTATDYPGLGTAGPHPFLVGPAEAHAVIDSVRAARALPGGAGPRFAVWGHSQGGHAALFTGMEANRYAPDLTLVGIAAAAPATDLARLFRADAATTGGMNITALTLWSWSKVYGVPMDTVVRPDAIAAVATVASECIGALRTAGARREADKQLAQSFLSVADLPATAPWSGYVAANSPRAVPRDVPVFLAQGTADTLVDPELTKAYAAMLCRNGNKVDLQLLPGVRHGFVAYKSSRRAIAWLADRFAGSAPPDECAAIGAGA